MSGEPPPDAEVSDDDQQHPTEASNRKRSSRACDQCRKTKSKCERFNGDDEPCQSCLAAGTACTFLGPSFKRGPPKGYIHAIEQRWHQVESILGAILSSKDPYVKALISNLRKDALARDILSRVDSGPFGPTGRLSISAGMTKEDFFASIMNSDNQHPRDPSRPKRQSRKSREIVSSNNSMLVTPTLEWQDRLSSAYARTDKPELSCASSPSRHIGGQPSVQRRRLDKDFTPASDWRFMHRLDSVSESDDDADDAASLIGELSIDENSEVRYHGIISGLHLLSQADRTDQRKVGGVWQLPMARVWPPSVNQFIPEESMDVAMPTLEIQRHLLGLYFIYVHPVFPVVHKALFWKDYEATLSFSSSSAREKTHISKLLLLSMFAIAARYDHAELPPLDPGNLWEAGLDYMLQARELLNRIYHYCRGTTCQALLLLGLREFGIGQMEHGWLYTGMAFRMAQDLGLHRDASLWQINGRVMFTPQELQARKQIWWGCVRADKYTAVYMGRPPTISEFHFDTPPPEEEADELWAPHRSDSASIDFKPVPSRTMATFRRVSTLCVIIGNVITRIYPVRPPSQAMQRAALSELGVQLDQWYAELPESLAFDPASTRTIPPPNVLLMHATYWGAVLLLHRAFIPKLKHAHSRHTSNSSRESEALAFKSFDICQAAASHMTSTMVMYRKQFGLSYGAILVTQHLFTAGVMQVVACTMQPSNVQTSVVLQQTLTCLKDLGVIWPSAYRSWGLIGGAKVHVDNGILNPKTTQRPKRPADEALGAEEGTRVGLPPQTFNFGPLTGADVASRQATDSRLVAHLLGLDIPSVDPASCTPNYEWWPNKPHTPDGTHAGSSESPKSTAMPIPFSFDQTHNFWDAPLLQDMGLNYITDM